MAASTGHNTPLRLFWWQGTPNFGDALSQIVVAHVSGRPVEHSRAVNADLFAVGSILQIVRRKYSRNDGAAAKPWIWGSGMLHAVPRDFLQRVEIALLRGPITAALLGIKATRYGDPGLLIADALGPRPAPGGRIGLVPHHSQLDDPVVRALAKDHPGFDLIDVRGDAAEVCRRIGACGHVFASSLHGLVTADAYGVASTWTDPGQQSHLKYHDYAASIGRPMIAPVAWADVPAEAKKQSRQISAELPYAAGIARAQDDLRNSFPAPLRASTDTGARLDAV